MSIDIKSLHLRVCLGAVALMAAVPFLMAHHYNPIPSFFQEWAAAALSLLALTALLQRKADSPMEVPEIALLPVGLMLIGVVQWLTLADALPDRLLMFGCYMVWTIFLIILGRHLTRTAGLQTVADVMATAILVGALLEALSGAVQLAGLARMPWFFPSLVGGVRGNLAQPNNFADYLWLGIASTVYLRSRGALGRTSSACCLLILLPFSLLSGSRSVWLYASGLALLSVAWTWGTDLETGKRLRYWALGAAVGSLLCQVLLNTGLAAFLGNIVTAGARVADESYDTARLTLWRMAANAFLEAPWLGVGFGQYTRYFHQHVLELMPYRLPGLPEHAHNMLLNLLAEFGLLAGALLLVFGFRWTVGLVRSRPGSEAWWVAGCALVLGIHSNLEYPLWYGFFLSIAALLAGAASRNNREVQLGRTAPYAMASFLLLGALALHNLYRDYSLLEDTLNGRTVAGSLQEKSAKNEKALAQVADESLLRPYVDFAVAHLMADDTDALDVKLQNCDRAQRFSAAREIVFKCAHLLALAGREEESRLALQRAVASYPDGAAIVLERWKKRSMTEPVLARLVADFPRHPADAPRPATGPSVPPTPSDRR